MSRPRALCLSLLLLLCMNPSSAEVYCSRFNVLLNVDGNGKTISLTLDTDLPNDTRLIVTVGRDYEEHNNTEEYSHNYFSAIKERVGDWREPHQIKVDSGKWKREMETEMESWAKLGIWNGMKAISGNQWCPMFLTLT